MIKGPWPLAPNKISHEVPLDRPYLTPMFHDERVALRVSPEDYAKCRRGPGDFGIITDLDTNKRYSLKGRPCSLGDHCHCDAEIEEV